MAEMRSMLGSLRNAEAGREMGPQPGAGRPARAGRLRAHRRASPSPTCPASRWAAWAKDIALTAYRIVQEALSNVIRHAPGATVHISLATTQDRLKVTVVNSPSALGSVMAQLDRGSHVGQGLIGMRERATIVGGAVTAVPTPGGGFSVVATLPLISTTRPGPERSQREHSGIGGGRPGHGPGGIRRLLAPRRTSRWWARPRTGPRPCEVAAEPAPTSC